ncbi:N-acetylglucosamine kinase [Amycolatopsis methanolica]|uniref:N-acetylglucosamine kinase n=1 Tax=Amycolatopsis methanolica 239 TaxID=1068978 RepID=A0A076N126_AMYME|nr:BadF/BadG/BcrA/BcrD ATPase family protein [Amycolatopsis methanolica]AIJ26548.1 N-acetylglucosamine kinase [Amycolatopsis methanolica 239]
MKFVLGVDAGGTSTRALAVAADGTVLGAGRAGGANPNSHPPAEAAANLAAAIRAATGVPGRASACVIGMAGTAKLTDPAVAALFERTWSDLGLDRVVVLTDAEVAFAAATDAPDGTVLIAGTGSIAGRIRKRRMVATEGGYGWLLGDEGSGFWLGREAVRATLAALGRDGDLGPLATAVLAEAGVDATDRKYAWRRLITVANAEPPVRLARFAPLVAVDDPAAADIVERAADLLVATALATREPGEDTPVVLVGSVLGDGTRVGERVRAKLAGLEVRTSSDGVLGAAWLAAVEAFGEAAARRPG